MMFVLFAEVLSGEAGCEVLLVAAVGLVQDSADEPAVQKQGLQVLPDRLFIPVAEQLPDLQDALRLIHADGQDLVLDQANLISSRNQGNIWGISFKMAVGIVHADIQAAVQEQGNIAVGMLTRLGDQGKRYAHLCLHHRLQPGEHLIHLPRLEEIAAALRLLADEGGDLFREADQLPVQKFKGRLLTQLHLRKALNDFLISVSKGIQRIRRRRDAVTQLPVFGQVQSVRQRFLNLLFEFFHFLFAHCVLSSHCT